MSDCERCSNMIFDEVYGDYSCIAPFDEDELEDEAEMNAFRGNSKRRCPYFIEDGEYKTVNKQI